MDRPGTEVRMAEGTVEGQGRRILGAVLAGGRSSRFGSDKAMALLDGRPLIDHCVAMLMPFADDIVICGRDHPDLTCIADRPAPDLGPLGGLNAALAYARAEGFAAVLTMACDTPVVPSALLEELIARPGGAYLRHLPIAGYWPVALADPLDGHLTAGGDRSVRRWAATVDVPGIAHDPVPNINSPEDLSAMAERTGTGPI